MGLPMEQKLVKFATDWVQMQISENARWIYTLELSRLVVVQHHCHFTLILDFQGQN